MKKIITLALGAAALAAAGAAGAARAEVIVYAGYYDLPPPNSGNTNPLPDPWVGSANTTFLGDTAYATSSDPDESALRIENTGPNSVTINPGLQIAGYQLWDTFIGAGFVLGAGQNVIFGATNGDNFDGSDQTMTQAISVGINGITHNFTDSSSVLVGFPAFDETIPWTEVGAVRFDGAPGVPEPASWALMIGGFGLAGAALRRRRTAVAA
jgi:opacity protein-like surface antigen